MVATCFHGTLLPLLLPRSVVAVCYHQMTHEMVSDLGQDAYALDLESFEAHKLLERFERLWERPAAEVHVFILP